MLRLLIFYDSNGFVAYQKI